MRRMARLALAGTALLIAACAPALQLPKEPVSTATPGAHRTTPETPLPGPPGTDTTLTAVAFSDALHGWAVGYSCAERCTLELATTRDGGSAWSAPVQVAVMGRDPLGASPQARFVRANGWIFGPAIFSTHDGGSTWRMTWNSPIEALEPSGGSVLAVTSCSDDPCRPELLTSAIGADDWHAVPQPALLEAAGQPGYPGVVLERAAGGTSFLSGATGRESQALYSSHDGGQTWSQLQAPCTGIVSIRSADSTHVWALCSTPCCTGNYVKGVFVSSDGGVSWSERAYTGLTTVGSINFYGPAGALAVTASRTAMYGGSGSVGVWRSTNAGTTWRPVLSGYCFGGGDRVSQLWFANPVDGWAVADANGDPTCPSLFHTTDGGTSWTPLASPVGPA